MPCGPCRLPSADAIAFSEMDRFAPEDDDVEEEDGDAAEPPRPAGEHGAPHEEIVQARLSLSYRPRCHLFPRKSLFACRRFMCWSIVGTNLVAASPQHAQVKHSMN